MDSSAYLVSGDWLTAADQTLNRVRSQGPAAPPQRVVSSRFYDIRPAKIVGDWTSVSSGVWKADARFIVNETVDESFVFPAFQFANEKPDAPDAENAGVVYVVWRGRWEALAAPFNLRVDDDWLTYEPDENDENAGPILNWRGFGADDKIGLEDDGDDRTRRERWRWLQNGYKIQFARDDVDGGEYDGADALRVDWAGLPVYQIEWGGIGGVNTPTLCASVDGVALWNPLIVGERTGGKNQRILLLDAISGASPFLSTKESEFYLGGRVISFEGFAYEGKTGETYDLVHTLRIAEPLTGTVDGKVLKLGVDLDAVETATQTLETETGEFLTSLGTPETETFLTGIGTPQTKSVVSNVSASTGTFLTGIGEPQTESVLSNVSTSTGTFLTGIGTPQRGTFLTGIGEPQTESVVSSVEAETADVLVSLGTPTEGTFLTGIGEPQTADVLSGVETTPGTFLTGLGETTQKTFLTALGTPETANVVQEIGEPNFDTFIKELGTPPKSDFIDAVTTESTTVLIGLTTKTKTVVTGVSLAASETASAGAVAVVVAVECADGSVVETTKYLSLNVQTETVAVIESFTEGNAVKSVETTTAKAVTDMPPMEYQDGESADDFEITKTGSAVVNLNPYKIDVLTSLGTPTTETATLPSGQPTTGEAVVSVTPTPTTVVVSLGTPQTETAIKSLPQAQTGKVVTSIRTSTTDVVSSLGTATTGAAITSLGTPSTATAVTNVTKSTTSVVSSLGQPSTSTAITSLGTPETATAITSATLRSDETENEGGTNADH